MTDFQGHIWAVQEEDSVNFVCITKRVKNKIQAINDKGRELKVSEDKLLWQYPSSVRQQEDWSTTATAIQATIDKLRLEIDVSLLWENALELQLSDIQELADLYFGGEITPEHLAAIWRCLAEDRLYFKRRGKVWEARTTEQIEELKIQREREEARIKAQALAKNWLQEIMRMPAEIEDLPLTGAGSVIANILPFVERLEYWLRGDTDKIVEELITPLAENAKLNPRELVFEILQKIGRLPLTADRDVIVAGLKPEFSAAITEAANAVQAWMPAATQAITELAFSIDDEETREVDDALSIIRNEKGWEVVIAISDPATVIARGDVLDREAMRRGTTVYLPTQTVLMLPEPISCDLASLTVGKVRSAIVLRAQLNLYGTVIRSSITREAVKVLKRLNYHEADELLANGQDACLEPVKEETAIQLRNLLTIATQLQEQRLAEGAFTLQRPEYKIHIRTQASIPSTFRQAQCTAGSGNDSHDITVTMINMQSPSRLLVAEMMILANYIAAHYAQRHQVPLIYRTQEAPLEPITPEMNADPLAFYKIRKLLRSSVLSLQPAPHSGLGLAVYTQLTSPLRRFADLVMQRQLLAHLTNQQPLPYNQEELFKVLATAERTAKEARQAETEAKKRWLMQYLRQHWQNQPLSVLVIETIPGGCKVEMQPWGVEAFLSTTKSLVSGEQVTAMIEKIGVKSTYPRLKLA